VTIEPANSKAWVMMATVLEHDLLGRQLRNGCDLPGAVAAMRKAKEHEPTDALIRAQLADLLTYGDDNVKFGPNAHLIESIDEYKSLAKDLGKEGRVYLPSLMLVLTHLGRWDEVKELVKTETNIEQRDIFHILVATATEGSAAGLKELAAFDDTKRRAYGGAVAQTLMALRRYNEAADVFESVSKGSPEASQLLTLVQIVRKAQPYEKTIDDGSFKAPIVRLMEALLKGDEKRFSALIVPELAARGFAEKDLNISVRSLRGISGFTTTMTLDVLGVALEVQQDGNDDIGYRLRLRSAFGLGTSQGTAYYVQRRDGRLLIAAANVAPDLIGAAALKLADDGKTEAARTWLNWARESIVPGAAMIR